ncbi:ATP-grasp domain-containing protein [Flavobacterium saliperosum]|uniref:Biotin carboxylase n=1 Tax=Flavobacterium saliperosum TaxID=329186 RepID=A0A1G4W3B3_9FLAO|nr:ATP-grasp domain-containing protein [Flavobacterium saliperosum]SCX16019.1 Biotin carboxylase [Flavobacterium saliperosum]
MRKLAIIGASYLQLPLVGKAKEMGIETHCFAWSEGAVCKELADYFYPISILEKEAILQECENIGIDGITTIATDMAVPTVCFVAEQLKLISNSVASGVISTNKLEMRKAFEKQNCNTPKFVETTSKNVDSKRFNFPLIVKPVDRSGSRGITKVNLSEELPNAISYALQESFAKKALVEEFVEGHEVSVESISWKGSHYILAITDKMTTGAPHFVELAHHQPSQLPLKVQEKIKAETIKCLNALEIKNGAGHSEFKITSEGEIFVIEVGARMGGDFIGSHLVELSTGYDFVKGVIDIALNTFEKPVLNKHHFSGVYFLSKETEVLQPYFLKDNDFDVEKQILNNSLKYSTNSNDRSGYLIYQSNKKINLL